MTRLLTEYEPDLDAARDDCISCWYYYTGVQALGECNNLDSENYGDWDCKLCTHYTPTSHRSEHSSDFDSTTRLRVRNGA